MPTPQLRYSPVAQNAPRFAADIVAITREGSRIRLDYTADSLLVVDGVIESIRLESPPTDAVAETLVGFGTYVGEVLVRRAGAEWVDFDESYRMVFGNSFGVRTPDGRMWDPVGRVFRRYAKGPRDSVYLLYLDAVEHGHG